jgi:hypothetical protein
LNDISINIGISPMLRINIVLAVAMSTVVVSPLQAAILSATPANFAAVFASANAGDTIKAVGSFGPMTLANRAFTKTVTIDATNAAFTNTLLLNNISRVTFLNGTFGSTTTATRTGRAVGLYQSNNVAFSKSKFIGNTAGVGLSVTESSQVVVSAGNFTGLKVGVGVTSSSDVRISSSRFTKMSSDGINIVDSHRVLATANQCSGTIATAGAHPDCIQLWSIAGNPVQSDITLTRNIVTGATQGLTSFTPAWGGGLRIIMMDNIISTSFPQGIACYACVDSIFTGNTLTTLPGARWRTSMNIVGGGNNIIANNTIGPRLPDGVAAVARTASGLVRSGFSAETMLSAVPEPAVWAQLFLGFGLIGLLARRRTESRAQPA